MTDLLTDPEARPRQGDVDEPTPVRRGVATVIRWYDIAQTWLFCDQRSLYGASFARILSGCAVLGILITNFRQRDLLFGPASVWNWKPRQASGLYWPPNLVDEMGSTPFLFFYLAVIALAVLWVLGWHAKIVGPLMLVGNIAIIERIPLMGDQGDNILRVGLFVLMFMHVTETGLLDARRRARSDAAVIRPGRGLGNATAILRNAYNSQPVLPAWLSNGIHNVTVAVLAFQLTLIYISAGMFKTRARSRSTAPPCTTRCSCRSTSRSRSSPCSPIRA